MRIFIMLIIISMHSNGMNIPNRTFQKFKYISSINRKIASTYQNLTTREPESLTEPDAQGRTLLHNVVTFDKDGALIENICEIFSKNNITLNLPDTNGDTPLHRAVLYGNVNAVKILLEHKASPHSRNKQGKFPIHHLVTLTNDEIANAHAILHSLKKAKANLNATDNNKNTAMHCAILQENKQIQKLFKLYEIGSDTIKNNDQHSATDLRSLFSNKTNRTEYVEMLQKKLTQFQSDESQQAKH